MKECGSDVYLAMNLKLIQSRTFLMAKGSKHQIHQEWWMTFVDTFKTYSLTDVNVEISKYINKFVLDLMS